VKSIFKKYLNFSQDSFKTFLKI